MIKITIPSGYDGEDYFGEAEVVYFENEGKKQFGPDEIRIVVEQVLSFVRETTLGSTYETPTAPECMNIIKYGLSIDVLTVPFKMRYDQDALITLRDLLAEAIGKGGEVERMREFLRIHFELGQDLVKIGEIIGAFRDLIVEDAKRQLGFGE
jgi:hypothetical protein